MLPMDSPVRSLRSAEVLFPTEGVLALDEALFPSEEWLRDSEEVCLRADVGFIGWLGTRCFD